MRIQIQSVVDKGVPDRERLVLRVLQDVDIGDFMLIRTGFEGNHVTTRVVNTFWFPDRSVNAGDIIVVYSKRGYGKEKEISDSRTAHFFYWGQDEPLWNNDDVAPVLLHAPEWVSKAPRDLASTGR